MHKTLLLLAQKLLTDVEVHPWLPQECSGNYQPSNHQEIEKRTLRHSSDCETIMDSTWVQFVF